METIVAAAVRHDGLVCSLPPPARHHDVLHMMANNGIPQDEQTVQGFMTDSGRFVNRVEACQIADAAGQIINKTYPLYELFSEDVW